MQQNQLSKLAHLCSRCGHTLSAYNKTGTCFSQCSARFKTPQGVYEVVSSQQANLTLRSFLPDPNQTAAYEQKRRIIADMIIIESAAHFGVTVENILSIGKDARYSLPRRVCYYLLHKDLKYAQSEVGRMLGNRTASNVYCSMQQLEKSIDKYIQQIEAVQNIVVQRLQTKSA